MQKTYLEIFERLTEAIIGLIRVVPSLEWFAKRHARMLFRPTKDEIDFFSSLYHLENFGLFEFTSFDAGEDVSINTANS